MRLSKFTSKQAYMLFLLASFAPAVRVLPSLGAKLGGGAGWVSVILSCVVYCGLVAVLHRLFQGRGQDAGLYEVYREELGKPVCTVLCVIYAAWIFILTALYLRVFAERFASSILPGIPYEFFMIMSLALFYIILGGSFRHFMNMTSISFYAVIICYGLIFAAKLTAIKPENLLPVTTLDAVPILKAMYPTLGIFSYITFLMFSAGEISDRENLKRNGLQSAVWLLFSNLVIFLTTVGAFGSELTQRFTLPFFTSIKTIKVFGSLERLESVFIIFWMIADIAIIAMLLHVLLVILDRLVRPKNVNIVISPLLMGAFVFAMYIVSNIFEVADFSGGFALAVNILLGLAIPVLVFLKSIIIRKSPYKD